MLQVSKITLSLHHNLKTNSYEIRFQSSASPLQQRGVERQNSHGYRRSRQDDGHHFRQPVLSDHPDRLPGKQGDDSRGYHHHQRGAGSRGAGACESHLVGTHLGPQDFPPLWPQRFARIEQR